MKEKIIATIMTAIMFCSPLAMAYDLGDYPTFLFEDHNLDAYVVVGADAATADVVGAVDLAARIAGESYEEVTTEASSGTVTVSDGYEFREAGDVLGYAEDLDTLAESGIASGELEVLLADHYYKETKGDTNNNVKYEQSLLFDPGNDGTLTMDLDIDESSSNEQAGTYIFFDSGEIIYEYTIEFDGNGIEYVDGSANADIANTQITLFGTEYTITSVTETAATAITKIELLSGTVEITQGEYTTETHVMGDTEYEVEVVIIADDDDEAKFKINGETTDALGEGDTDELSDGTIIGVVEVLPNEGSEESGADQVTFYLGATKLELEHDAEVKVNGQALDDYDGNVTITDADGTEQLTKIELTLSTDDDLWLGVGDEWVDPIFGEWKLIFAEIEEETEEIVIDVAGGDDGYLEFTNVAGDVIKIPMVLETTSDDVAFGEKAEFIDANLANGEGTDGAGTAENYGLAWRNADACEVTNGVGCDSLCKDFMFIAISSTNEARLYSIRDIDTTAKTFDIIDEMTGEKVKNDASCDSAETVTIPGMGSTFQFDCETDTDIFEFEVIDLAGDSDMKTSLAGRIQLVYAADSAQILIEDGAGNQDTHEINDDDADDDMKIIFDVGTEFKYEEDSDRRLAKDNANWGIIYDIVDTTEDTDVTITYPKEIEDNSGVSGIVYISPVAATTTTSGGSTAGTVKKVVPVTNAVAKLDSEISNPATVDKDLILVGGPGVNELSAQVLGLTYPTYGSSGLLPFSSGEGYIALFEDATAEGFGTGQIVVLVAGWEADDTRNACSVLQQYGSFASALDGNDAVIVTSVTSSGITAA